jgi:zinc protease
VSLPIDPQLVYGKLDNGLTYYIRKNGQPQQRAEFYLVQQTGCLQEDENQRGLAHFLEQMAFNGSIHFPDQGIDRYLERIGLKSGENLNAYTAFDETVFMLMNAPVSREGIIDSCLLILRDISSGLLLDDASIEKERAVIREEWRSGQDASARLTEQQLPVLLAGSKYAERLPIGRIEVIENFKPEDLKDYYRKWYRPDLQAVIVVGDVDTADVRKKIETLFGEIPVPDSPVKRKKEPVPDRFSPALVIAKDKEAPGYIVNLFYPYEKLSDSLYASVEGIRTDYLQTIVSSLLNERLEEKLYESNPPFVFAESSIGNYMGTQSKSAWSIAAIAEEGRTDSTLLVLAQEAERVRRFGFTFSEYERMKINVLKYYESLFLERDSEENSTYAESYIAHFTNGGYLPAIETEFDWLSRIADETSLDEVNRFANDILKRRDQAVISITGPEKNNPKAYPEKATLLDLFNQVAYQDLQPYQERDSLAPLLSLAPSPGEIIKEETDTLFHAVRLTLSNGVRVVAKQTSFKEDEIVLSGTSPGGSTLFDAKDWVNLKVFSDVVSLGGLGDHSATDLSRILAGKNVSCSISMDDNSESIGGFASVSDLRTLFELVYLHFTSLRKDEDAFLSYRIRMRAQLKNLDLNPMVAFGDSLTTALFGNSQKVTRITEEELNQVDYNRVLEMYQERFADASDFVFTLVGSFNMDSVRTLAKEYLAVLPTLGRSEQGDVQALVPYRRGEFRNVFTKKMETSKATVIWKMCGKLKAARTPSILWHVYMRFRKGGLRCKFSTIQIP